MIRAIVAVLLAGVASVATAQVPNAPVNVRAVAGLTTPRLEWAIPIQCAPTPCDPVGYQVEDAGMLIDVGLVTRYPIGASLGPFRVRGWNRAGVLTWGQTAATPNQALSYIYRAYADQAVIGTVLAGVWCVASGTAGIAFCWAPADVIPETAATVAITVQAQGSLESAQGPSVPNPNARQYGPFTAAVQ